jgi:hypothetical protein
MENSSQQEFYPWVLCHYGRENRKHRPKNKKGDRASGLTS